MNINADDKYTPIQFIPNSCLHLAGGCRPIGYFLVGKNGLRIFCPNTVASSFVSIGGMSILLCLIAMVNQLSELYASLKALTCILQSSQIARREMNRVKGYQVCCYFLYTFRDRFRILWNIYGGAFLRNTIFAEKLHHRCLTRFKYTFVFTLCICYFV